MLGGCYTQQGDIAGAIAHFDRALAIKPDYEEAIVKKIFALDFAPDTDFAVHQAVRREWWDRIGVTIPQRELRRQMPDPDKRIVVGYGFWIFLLSDIVMFSALFAAYAVLAHATAGGPGGVQLFNQRSVVIETCCLLASSYTCGMMSLAISQRRYAVTYLAALITFVLGATFLALELREFAEFITTLRGF